jgi:hypothetical protein
MYSSYLSVNSALDWGGGGWPTPGKDPGTHSTGGSIGLGVSIGTDSSIDTPRPIHNFLAVSHHIPYRDGIHFGSSSKRCLYAENNYNEDTYNF